MQINIGGQRVGLERAKDADIVYISHAHKDHAIETSKDIISSEETFELIKNGNGKKIRRKELPEGIELFSSGHMLGSTQIKITNGKTIVYTSDFKLRDGFTTKSAEIFECDTLIIDSTYNDPAFVFPSKEEIAEDISSWVKENIKSKRIVFGAYRLGKAQELIKIINEYAGMTPLVDSSIEFGCKIYERFGMKLDRIELGSEEGKEMLRDNFLAILPFHKVNQKLESQLKDIYGNVICAVVVGWCMKYKYPIKAFPLSDHAGYDEISRYIKESEAKEIIYM